MEIYEAEQSAKVHCVESGDSNNVASGFFKLTQLEEEWRHLNNDL